MRNSPENKITEGVRGVEGMGEEILVQPVGKTVVEKIFPCSPLRTSCQSREHSEEEAVVDMNSYELTATLHYPSHLLLLGQWSQKGMELGIKGSGIKE